jgi:flagellar biosynthesis protein FlhF
MRMKSFTARSLPDAMSRVRDHLGPDAVILSQRDLDEGGVRITAGVEAEAGGGSGLFASAEGLVLFDRIASALDRHRVPLALTDRLFAACNQVEADTAQLALGGALDAVLRFEAPPVVPTGRPLLLLGPPGAGKTAVAAKLAAHARIRGSEATLITLDLGKAGGLAQMQAFAEALGAELRQAQDTESLRRALADLDPNRLVIVDTLGASPYDADALRELGEWVTAADADGVLVLPAGGDPTESEEIAQAYAETGATRLITTKLDSVRRLGGVLAAAHAGPFALVGLGVSATIGGGLRAAGPMQLARLLLPEPDDGARAGSGPDAERRDEGGTEAPEANGGASRTSGTGGAAQ